MQIFNRNMLTIKLSPDLIELHRKMDELLSSVHARILAGETIEQIYASMGLEYAPDHALEYAESLKGAA